MSEVERLHVLNPGGRGGLVGARAESNIMIRAVNGSDVHGNENTIVMIKSNRHRVINKLHHVSKHSVSFGKSFCGVWRWTYVAVGSVGIDSLDAGRGAITDDNEHGNSNEHGSGERSSSSGGSNNNIHRFLLFLVSPSFPRLSFGLPMGSQGFWE